MHTHIKTFPKATQDIAAGQELFYRYGRADWFAARNVSYANFDYASTRWRPDLHPLPCRKNVVQSTGADGQHSYVILEAVPSGTVLEISLCLKVPVVVVDQFPFLWDFVLTGETENVHAGCQQTGASSRALTTCVFCRPRRRENRRTR